MAAKRNKKNIVNLQMEVVFSVDGEEEKDNTLSWEILKKIGDNTQKLIDTLLKFSLSENKIAPELTRLVFIGFFKGSAVPAWKLPNLPNLLFPVQDEVNKLNDDFNFIIKSLDKGNFQQIADHYNESAVKNEVIEVVHAFSNSAGSKPFTVVKREPNYPDKFRKIARVRKMDLKHKNLLQVMVPNEKETTKEKIEVLASLKVSGLGSGGSPKFSKKDLQLYTEKEATLALKFDLIETNKRIYILKGEVPFILTNLEKEVYSIDSPLLDIYAYGTSVKEAEDDFFIQFDYTYQRLTNLSDNQLSEHLKNAKTLILLLVDNVKSK